jgi:inorganic triphosphatase YgiF
MNRPAAVVPGKRQAPSAAGAAASREVELKLAVPARDLPRLRQRLAQLGTGEAVEVDNVYYDTAEHLLRAHRMALRVRRIGGRWLQTLKTEAAAAALTARGEWEVPAPRGRLDLQRFPPNPLAALLAAHPGVQLQPVFRTRFHRTLWPAEGGRIEIALDEGEIRAGVRQAPILELELELKSGDSAALYARALALAGRGRAALALRPAVESKAARGYRLAAGEAPQPAKANARAVAADLAPRTPVAQALRHVVARGTTLLLTNVAGLEEAEDAEFIHQARVAVRRMRSAARLLRKRAGWPATLDAELRWIGRQLGAVRDWDVLAAQTLPAMAAALPELAQALAAQVGSLRQRDEAKLRAVVAGPRFAAAALRLLQWAHGGDTEGPTLKQVAVKKLARLHRRLFSSAAFFVALPAEEQHRVRIRAKRLRYALDLFACALPARATARYVEALASVQDELGVLNDVAVAAELLPRLAKPAGVDVAPALAWLDERRRAHALSAEAALAALSRLPLPWR